MTSLRLAFTDSTTMLRRDLRHALWFPMMTLSAIMVPVVILLLFVVASTALYGPQAAALVEMFPTRVRYTAMSFPYHVGTGWVGAIL